VILSADLTCFLGCFFAVILPRIPNRFIHRKAAAFSPLLPETLPKNPTTFTADFSR
jgi:hypothetical protein